MKCPAETRMAFFSGMFFSKGIFFMWKIIETGKKHLRSKQHHFCAERSSEMDTIIPIQNMWLHTSVLAQQVGRTTRKPFPGPTGFGLSFILWDHGILSFQQPSGEQGCCLIHLEILNHHITVCCPNKYLLNVSVSLKLSQGQLLHCTLSNVYNVHHAHAL